MSFGDPNNPYGAPQGQQPGYGYPQQPQAPGYGYPQAPPVQGYGGGPVMTTMPGTVSAARVMLWVIVGLQLLGVALFAFTAASVNAAKNDEQLKDDAAFQQLADYSAGMIWGLTVFALAWAVFAIVLAVKFNSGGNGVRVTLLVFAIITAILGLYPFVIVGLVHTVLAILIAVFVGNSAGSAWFNRQRF
ncbi:hypothetical protein F7R91_17215 [Streptomyces luteolifulvus]|jgi:hypothetical protein|uniref:Uncharacterized protein n=1 Tax=Streptomyces luteolifulvus TaxID=2615112 RepID=A0A6H9V1X1_9ACTN|nr:MULTISPECIES: proline-rich domain-containing protein [Streptomyces]KAB1146051.1 hypothetical protein F7R91_17215 [Streptomyces luteolifulvus]MXM67273.1 hypothetical protein [Streptomyces sp. HUCO-GS316]